MSKFNLTFTLRQHTPLIHFQHEQRGAGLRATEMKPALDAFLLRKLKEGGRLDEKWLMGSQSEGQKGPALHYKLGIRSEGKPFYEMIEELRMSRQNPGKIERDRSGKPKLLSFPAFFGNLGLDAEKEKSQMKHFLLYDKVQISFFSFYPDLLEVIEQHFGEFMALHNFGTRQSKGFGSFYPEDEERYPFESYFPYGFTLDTAEVDLPKYCRFNDGRSPLYITFFKLFYALNLFYSSIRSGLNIRDLYFKSLMFMYAKEKGIQWDKKTIRDKFHLFTQTYKRIQRRRLPSDGTFLFFSREQRLMRDMLGLSSEQSWMAYKDTITKSHDTIERFKSPVFFKIIRLGSTGVFRVFIRPQPIPGLLFDTPFQINSRRYGRGKSLKLKTPTEQQFDLEEFLRFCFKDIFPDAASFEKHVNFSTSPEATLLKGIYMQLNKG